MKCFNKGFLIVFEGIDGVGKTTQAFMLYQYLKELGRDCYYFHEPGGTNVANVIKQLLMNEDLDFITELLLFEASRSHLVHRKISKLLQEGSLVILDRYIYSTLAYQGYGRGIDLNLIKLLNDLTTRNIKPDITFFLDAPIEVVFERLQFKRSRLEKKYENQKFLEKVRHGYLEIAKTEFNIFVIDANRNPEEIFNEVIKILKQGGVI